MSWRSDREVARWADEEPVILLGRTDQHLIELLRSEVRPAQLDKKPLYEPLKWI